MSKPIEKILLALASVVLAGMLMLALAGPMALRVIASRTLTGVLGTQVGIGAVTVRWADKALEVTDIRIAQPVGYGAGDCLSVGRIYARPAWSALSRARLELNEIAITDVRLRLVENPEGLNVAALLDGDEQSAAPPAGSDASTFALLVRELHFDDVAVDYDGVSVALAGGVTNLLVCNGATAAPPDAVTCGAGLRAVLAQPGAPDAIMTLTARCGALGVGIPQGAVSLKLEKFLPHGLAERFGFDATRLIGAGAVDLRAELTCVPDTIGARFSVEQSGASESGAPDEKRLLAGLDSGEFSWRAGRLQLSKLVLNQPVGYAAGPLLVLPHAVLEVDMPALESGIFRAGKLELAGLLLHLVRDVDGALNIDRFQPASASAPESVGADSPAGTERSINTVIETLALTNGTIIWTDRANADDLLHVEAFDLAGVGAHLRMGTFPDNELGRFAVAGRIRQEVGSNAYAGVAVVTAPLGNGIPAMNVVVRIVGLELATLQPILPVGAARALGAPALDFDADVALDARTLNARLGARPANAAPLALTISGTPDRPVVDGSGILFNVLLRAGGGVGGLARDIAGVGVDTAGAALTTVRDVGRTAGDLAMDIGDGLLQTVRGVAGGNMAEVAGGLHKTTLGAAGQVAAGLRDVGAATFSDAVDAVTPSVAQQTALEQWRSKAPERWAAGWAEDLKTLDQ